MRFLSRYTNNSENNVAVKEIPIKQHDTVITRKLDFDRILNYSKDVWELYRYGIKSKLKTDKDNSDQKISRSVTILVKGR